MIESAKSGRQTLSRPSELGNDPPSPIGKVSIPMLRFELPQVTEVFTASNLENFIKCLVWSSCGVLFLAKGEKHVPDVPNLVTRGPKFRQTPSPKSSTPHVLQNHVPSLWGLPRRQRAVKVCQKQPLEHPHHTLHCTSANSERCAREASKVLYASLFEMRSTLGRLIFLC